MVIQADNVKKIPTFFPAPTALYILPWCFSSSLHLFLNYTNMHMYNICTWVSDNSLAFFFLSTHFDHNLITPKRDDSKLVHLIKSSSPWNKTVQQITFWDINLIIPFQASFSKQLSLFVIQVVDEKEFDILLCHSFKTWLMSHFPKKR